jgi:hypothetical protein
MTKDLNQIIQDNIASYVQSSVNSIKDKLDTAVTSYISELDKIFGPKEILTVPFPIQEDEDTPDISDEIFEALADEIKYRISTK